VARDEGEQGFLGFGFQLSDMYDVPKEQYVSVIREMIRHENDLTNHRTMWL
jgi:hypothetical protein